MILHSSPASLPYTPRQCHPACHGCPWWTDPPSHRLIIQGYRRAEYAPPISSCYGTSKRPQRQFFVPMLCQYTCCWCQQPNPFWLGLGCDFGRQRDAGNARADKKLSVPSDNNFTTTKIVMLATTTSINHQHWRRGGGIDHNNVDFNFLFVWCVAIIEQSCLCKWLY